MSYYDYLNSCHHKQAQLHVFACLLEVYISFQVKLLAPNICYQTRDCLICCRWFRNNQRSQNWTAHCRSRHLKVTSHFIAVLVGEFTAIGVPQKLLATFYLHQVQDSQRWLQDCLSCMRTKSRYFVLAFFIFCTCWLLSPILKVVRAYQRKWEGI